MIPEYTASCFAQHMGLWHIEPLWFNRAFAAIKTGMMQPKALGVQHGTREAYALSPSGTATIPLYGHMTKGGDSYGGASTILTRAAIRQALRDDQVQRILLHIDSPGGHVAGTSELARAVREGQRTKPIDAHIEDLGASAAYYVASQARRITATPESEIGSIGTLLVVEDRSEQAKMAGVDVVALSTGMFKGTGVPGTALTPEQRAYLQERVDNLNAGFRTAVQTGRHLSDAQLDAVSDGRVFIDDRAQQLGLIDAIQPLDATLAQLDQSPGKGMRMSLHDTLTGVFRALGGKGSVEIHEEPREPDAGEPQVVDPSPVPEPDLLDAALVQAKAALTAAEPELALTQGQQQLQAMLDEARTLGYADGIAKGRHDAAEIAAHCHVAEQPMLTHRMLAVQDDGSCLSLEMVRSVLNEMQVVAQEVATVTSQVLPLATSTPRAGKSINTAETYARRRSQ